MESNAARRHSQPLPSSAAKKPIATYEAPSRRQRHPNRRRSEPVDAIDLARRLHIVQIQQLREEAAAAKSADSIVNRMVSRIADRAPVAVAAATSTDTDAGASRMKALPIRWKKSPPPPLQLSQLPIQQSPPGTAAAAAATDPPVSPTSQPYVPREAALQFVSTTTTSGAWRPASFRMQKPSDASIVFNDVAPLDTPEAKPEPKSPQAPRPYESQHAYESHCRSVILSTGDISNLLIRKSSSPDSPRDSSPSPEQETGQTFSERSIPVPDQRRDSWRRSQRFSVDPQIVEEHRIDWTQQDEAVLERPRERSIEKPRQNPRQQPRDQPQEPQESQESQRKSMRYSRSLWTLRTLSGGTKAKSSVSAGLEGKSKTSSNINLAMQPPGAKNSPKALKAQKTPRPARSSFFSLFKHSN